MILRDLLRDGGRFLSEAGIEGAQRDARALLAGVLELEPSRLSLEPDLAITPDSEARFRSFLERRSHREPVAKILGRRQFWGRDFIVTADVLDPRPETEGLVAEALSGGVFRRVLDLGTGSGILAVSLLAENPAATAVATDISQAALNVARRNGDRHGVGDRIEFVLSDWFSAVEGQFDLIVSNPPYISEAEMAGLSPEVVNHDPLLALTPGGDGLSPYVTIAEETHRHLAPQGRLLVEIGAGQGPDVVAIFRESGLSHVQVHQDLDGRDRVVSATIA